MRRKVLYLNDERERAVEFINSALRHGHYTGTRWVNTSTIQLVEVHWAEPPIRAVEKWAVVAHEEEK